MATNTIKSFLPQELIRKKRDGLILNDIEIGFLVRGISDSSLTDAQLGAFAMAVFHNGMNMDERISLTQHMMHSGSVLQWQDLNLNGPVVDKHSTGGVGDKVSLMLAPIVAACGGYVPMISGRGLGHTGGTLDKLDSIPGYNATPDEAQFRNTVQQVGCAIIGQTAQLAPADQRFYATRDVTATVESISLITASILSKKLASGLDALVMDVKTGNGAFADTYSMAQELAQSIADVATGSGVPTRCLITDMNQVLGRSVGNAVEVHEVGGVREFFGILQGDLTPGQERLNLSVGDLFRVRVDIGEFRMFREHAVIRRVRIEILDQMIPRVPLPDDFARTRTRLSHLDEVIGPQLIVVEQ